MTLFNHCKYHFTQGIPIPSRAIEKTKAHQVRPFKSIWRLAAGRDTREELWLFRENLFWCETAKWEKMKESEFITVKSRWIWQLVSAQRWYLSFDSSRKHLLSHDCDDQVIPHDGSDQRLNFLPVWYFNVKTIWWEGLFRPSCRLTTHWNNYGMCLHWYLQFQIFFLGFVSCSILCLHCSTKWIPTKALPQTLVVHVLLVIALLLTFSPHWGNRNSLMQ